MFHLLIGLLGVASPAWAVDGPAIQRLLNDASGWTPAGGRDGIEVFQKPVPALGLTAYKGVTVVAVDHATLYRLIADVAHHDDFNDMLADSVVLGGSGNAVDFYQVADTPDWLPISDRFWFNRTVELRDLGGSPGHHRREWFTIEDAAGRYAAELAQVQARFPKAVQVTVSYGSWEVRPLADGQVELTYRTVSHPGGTISTSLAATLAERTLPDNMLRFVHQAQKTGG